METKMSLLKDKVALITGGARGIGRDIASVFADNGCNLVLGDIDEEALVTAVGEIEGRGVSCEGYKLDVSSMESVQEAVGKSIDRFGRIDILINNAGITRDNLLLRMKEDDFDKVIAINLKGTFNCTKVVSRIMLRQHYGRIISISSVIGLIGNISQVNYAASKAGIIGLTKSTARELASRNITVNAVAPGYIQTAMTEVLSDEVKERMLQNVPLGKPGTPADVANAVLFLASDLASYMTGQVLVVDGGMVM